MPDDTASAESGPMRNPYSHPALTNGDWDEIRDTVLERDDHECQKCGKDHDLQVHHIKAANDGGTDDPDNLVTLCNGCHWSVHRHGPNEDGLYTPDIGSTGLYTSSGFYNDNVDLSETEYDILTSMPVGEPIKRSEILDRSDYDSGAFTRVSRYLRLAGMIERVDRGYYRRDERTENYQPDHD